jgi:hypothetical protein
MKKFKLLWFEDNIQNFDRIIPKLVEHAKMNNHVLDYDHFVNYPNNFDVQLFEGVYSLVFVDLNLSNGQKGIDVIEILKTNGAFIDTLLYSNNAEELIQLTEGENYVEGIFRHATMNGILDKMNNVIDQVIYKETMVIVRNNE